MDDRDRLSNGTFRKGNKASISSGLRSGLCLSRLPKGCGYISRALARFRSSLEDAVRERQDGKPLSVLQCCQINRAVLAEQRNRLAQRWLDRRWEKMATAQFLELQGVIEAATRQRDELVGALVGNDRTADGLAGLLGGPFGGMDPQSAGASADLADK